MGLVSTAIPNLVNGVSQQPPTMRLASQCEIQDNCYPSVVDGLKKRAPTEHITKVLSGTVGAAHVHMINRDPTERYFVLLKSGVITVFDLQGNIKTVNVASGLSYLTSSSPTTDFRTVTIEDHTFIVNKTVKVGMSSTLSTKRSPEALVSVKVGNYGQDYIVNVNGTQVASKTTSTTAVTDIATNKIASDLYSQLVSNLGAAYTVTLSSNTIWIRRVDGADFTISTTDSYSGKALLCVKGQVQRFSDLPAQAPDGFQITIAGDNTSKFDNYYVAFKATNSGGFGDGVWEEWVKPGIQYKLDPATMPHVLVREADGSFTFKEATWGDRVAGDEDLAPNPSFVGWPINDVFLFKNRLGLLSDTNVIMSRSGELFEFFPSTVTTILDSDPIDVSSPTADVSYLRYALTFNKQLLILSDQAQFILSSGVGQGNLLTPKTVALTLTTKYDTSASAVPVGAGKNVFFSTKRGGFAGVREYYMTDTSLASTTVGDSQADDVTAHVPKYIKGTITKMTNSSVEDVLFCMTDADPSKVYIYKYHWNKNEKLQSSWGTFTFDAGTTVLGFGMIDTALYLLMQHSDGVYLEVIYLDPGRFDPYTNVNGQYGFVTLLDRRVSDAQCTLVQYNALTNTTSFTLPYAVAGEMQVVTRATSDPTKVAGIALTVASQSGNVVSVHGNHSATPVWIGLKYTMQFRFSPFVMRQGQGGGQTVIEDGRLQIRKQLITFAKTGYFQVLVTQQYRDPSVYTYTGRILGAGSSIIGQACIDNGNIRFPILSKSNRVTVDVVNDNHMPCNLLSSEWEGMFVLRSNRV